LHRICVDSTCRPLHALSPSIVIFINHVYDRHIKETLPLLTVLQETPFTYEQHSDDERMKKEEGEEVDAHGKGKRGRNKTQTRRPLRMGKAKKGTRQGALIPPHLRELKTSISKILSRCSEYPPQQMNDIKSAYVLITEYFKTYERLAFQMKTLRHTAETAPTSIL